MPLCVCLHMQKGTCEAQQTACLLLPHGWGREFTFQPSSVSLHAGSGLCRSSLLHSGFSGVLWRAVSFLISASLVDNAVHEVMKHRALLPEGLEFFSYFLFCFGFCGENVQQVFTLFLFFPIFLPEEIFSRGEQPFSYLLAGSKLPKAQKIKLILVINPLVHYLLFAVFRVYELFVCFFLINLIFNQSVNITDLPIICCVMITSYRLLLLSMNIVDTPSAQQIPSEADILCQQPDT